jgi:putative intracellular protease/amidase
MTTTKNVHLAIYDTLADWEIGYVTAHVNSEAYQREPGRYRVVTVAATAEPVTTMGGLRIVPDMTLDDLRPDDSALLILAGADAWLTGGNTEFVGAAQAFLDAGVPVAAICGATGGLAAGGLLDDRRHTSNALEYLQSVGYGGTDLYVDAPAVTDRGLITATATAPAEFAREIFTLLDLYEPAVLAAWYKLYGLHDPAGYYELMSATA